MASYSTHLGLGGMIGAGGVAVLSAYSVAKDFKTLAIVFLLTLFGSILPDVDSDSSVPFRVVFAPLAFAFGSLVTYETLLYTTNLYYRIAIPIIAFVLFWFIVGELLKNLTHHRGIFHSLPMMVIVSLATVLLAEHLKFTNFEAVLFGLAIGTGFLSHLLLDEIHAILHNGKRLILPNKAFGSALKLWAPSILSTVTTYVIAILFYLSTSSSLHAAAAVLSKKF